MTPINATLLFGTILWLLCVGGTALANRFRHVPLNGHRIFLWLWFAFSVLSLLAVLIGLRGEELSEMAVYVLFGYAILAFAATFMSKRFKARRTLAVRSEPGA